MSRIDAFELVPTTEGDHRRALALQRRLAERGQHRALSRVDVLLAAAAEGRNLTALQYDADFDVVSEITGQPTQWVAEPGTAD